MPALGRWDQKGRGRKGGRREGKEGRGKGKRKDRGRRKKGFFPFLPGSREERKESFISNRRLVNPTVTGTEQGLEAL